MSERREGGRGQRGQGGHRGPRQKSRTAPSARSRQGDLPRSTALRVLRAVSHEGAYANLELPKALRRARLSGRDAGFATELTYGTLRLLGRYDAMIAACTDRPLERIDPAVLDVLRLGAHQLMGMRVARMAAAVRVRPGTSALNR